MDVDRNNIRLAVKEDRLGRLPDEVIQQIFQRMDTIFVVQTCLLSPRWGESLWKSMPCLDFSIKEFKNLPKFARFVNHVLTHRNHQVDVSSLKLDFHGAASEYYVKKIANYAYSHNLKELTIIFSPKSHSEFSPCLFSSPSLENFKFSTYSDSPCVTPKTPWDFPALTTLHISQTTLCNGDTRERVDIFSKCVNLKNLTLKKFKVNPVGEFDIIAPRLSTLVLIEGKCSHVINLITPQLKSLTIIQCNMRQLNAPQGLSSLCYMGLIIPKFINNGFHALDKVTITVQFPLLSTLYYEGEARNIINLLQMFHSTRFLTLNTHAVECISSYPDLLSENPSPLSNLIRLKIDTVWKNSEVKFSTEAVNFLLQNSPNATLIVDTPELDFVGAAIVLALLLFLLKL